MSRSLVLSLVLVCGCACAAEPLPFPRPSSFDARKIQRDPFTPLSDLGIVEKTAVVESVAGKAASQFDLTSLFRVSSISIAQLSIAIINGRAFAEGESFDMRTEGHTVKRVTVLKITDGKVDVDYGGYKLSLPLARKEPKPLEER